MEKILILTSEYPNPYSDYDTPVVHYYAKEWVKMGYHVSVIHYRSVFPSIYYKLADNFRPLIKRMFRTDFIPDKPLLNIIEHQIDNVSISLVPLCKNAPHLRYSRKVIMGEVGRIVSQGKSINFIPDLIVGHFFNPQIELISELKRHYPEAVCSIVFHEGAPIVSKRYGNELVDLLSVFDHIGFRYRAQLEAYTNLLGYSDRYFLCPSGAPERYIADELLETRHRSGVFKFCFAGMLIPLKNVEVIIYALHKVFPSKNFEFSIIGDGMLRKELEERVIELGLKDNVVFHGKLGRDQVQEQLRRCDVFVMVSAPEAFGLVYLEAMGKGCVTIGSINQGIDGVIKDGFNGFLCKPSDIESLSDKITHIASLSDEEICSISREAILTARKYTDQNVASHYVNKLINNTVCDIFQ